MTFKVVYNSSSNKGQRLDFQDTMSFIIFSVLQNIIASLTAQMFYPSGSEFIAFYIPP